MKPIDLEPRYSTSQVPGKCIKCLAEKELNNCFLELLGGNSDNKELQQKYEMLVAFLKSSESLKLRDEAERYLAEGKKVTVSVNFETGRPKYELKID